MLKLAKYRCVECKNEFVLNKRLLVKSCPCCEGTVKIRSHSCTDEIELSYQMGCLFPSHVEVI